MIPMIIQVIQFALIELPGHRIIGSLSFGSALTSLNLTGSNANTLYSIQLTELDLYDFHSKNPKCNGNRLWPGECTLCIAQGQGTFEDFFNLR